MHAVSALGAAQYRYLLSALERLPEPSRVFGITARLMTGSGTFMLTIVYLCMAGAHTTSADCSLATVGLSKLSGVQRHTGDCMQTGSCKQKG